jgi:hypothetical protein
MDVQAFAQRVIDLAERLSDVADAATGKRRRHPSAVTRWLVLPATGAGLYALAKSDFLSQQAKIVVEEARTLASELPDDLVTSVRQASQSPTKSSSSATGNSSASARRRTSRNRGKQRPRTTSASRRTSGS